MTRRSLISLALVASVALGACSSDDGPAVLQVGANRAGAERMAAPAGAALVAGDANAMIAPGFVTSYEWAGGDLPGAGEGRAYRLNGIDRDDVARVAEAFGMTGEVTEQDGAFVVGPQDGTGPSLWVGTSGVPYFSFNDPGASPQGEPCVVPAAPPAAEGGSTAGAAATTSAPVSCPPPPLPTGLPSEADAQARALELLAAAGFPTEGAEVTVDASEYGVWVGVVPVIDGLAVAELGATVGFGDAGAVAFASGWIGGVEPADTYPVVSGEEAFAFLQAGELWGPPMAAGQAEPLAGADSVARAVEPAVGTMTPDATTNSDSTVSADGTGSADGTVSADGTSSEGSEGSAGSAVEPGVVIAPGMPEPAPMEQMTIRLTGVRAGLQLFFDAEGTAYLLPSWVFTADEAGDWNVLAVQRTFLTAAEG